jgi:Flp pilus assembly pilin Flp
MTGLVSRILHDERGQDLIEYALLTTVVALASVGVFGLIQNAIQAAYTSWNSGTNSIWQPPDP